MKPKEADKIIRKTIQIDGWFSFWDARLFAWIDEIQKSNGLVGDIFEIGVYHGKSAVFLGAMLSPTREKLGMCDVFEAQTKKVPGSATGDRQILEHNLKRYLYHRVDTHVFAKSSAELTVEEIGRNHRFIYIDGGHTVDDVLSDLKLAASSLIEEGVIVLDDAMAPVWPGIAEAIFHFLLSDKRFCAIVLGFNKMVLVRRKIAGLYTRQIDDEELRVNYKFGYPCHWKKIPFMNHPLRVVYIPGNTLRTSLTRRTKLIQYYQQHNWPKHPSLRPIVLLAKSIVRQER
ncbi:class I SAM-dependent methyltransferase [candidate division KSB1 bacterium]|nr:class I SAM-dependent methyltransferase [candidate division KSB1 bacterium]NIR71665.1 class I SAM-dependent methyltransferase [candidate division KSB1 bacterium]NIS26377.1 class I SAM-dependent methyltransferase [candidate division KSB1 bacterium]NIT73136.1 class I SAM-dependent methyltransferase [candidate division KSB1 bacterium]NIU27063.1 class I SAM-dependent methyltransferase [candidate division KSB1 bacterium]